MKETVVLHSSLKSPYAISTRIVLELKKISYTVVEEKLGCWTQFLKDNLQIPQVPILVHNKKIIRNANEINLYLDENFTGPQFTPENDEGKICMHEWWRWCDSLLGPAVKQYGYREDANFQKEGSVKVARLFGFLENRLATMKNLCSNNLTLTDIAVIPFVWQALEVEDDALDLTRYPHVQKWANQILEASFFNENVMAEYPFAVDGE